MSVIVLNHGVSREHIASVHAVGCAAIEKDKRDHASVEYGPYASLIEALDSYLDDEMIDMGYGVGDVKVHGCARKGG